MAPLPELKYADRLNAMNEKTKAEMLKRLYQAFAELKERFAIANLARIDEFIQTLSGTEEIVYPHPLQKPTLLYFPGLTAKPWHDTSDFAWVPMIEASCQVVKAELTGLIEQGYVGFYQEDSPTFNGPQRGWKVAVLDQHGRKHLENCRRCPETVKLIENNVPHSLRELQFSAFEPGTHVASHHGVTNVILTCHLALITPPTGAGVRVGEETRYQQEGKCLIFDDTFIHEAWNEGDSTRTILMWDIWHPELTQIEIESIKYLFPIVEKYLFLNSANYLISNGSVYLR